MSSSLRRPWSKLCQLLIIASACACQDTTDDGSEPREESIADGSSPAATSPELDAAEAGSPGSGSNDSGARGADASPSPPHDAATAPDDPNGAVHDAAAAPEQTPSESIDAGDHEMAEEHATIGGFEGSADVDAALPPNDASTTPPQPTTEPDAGTPPIMTDAAPSPAFDASSEAGTPVADAAFDAEPPPSECEVECEAAGGVCIGDALCKFDCSSPGSCTFDIECPGDYDCQVLCSGEESCSGSIECPGSPGVLCAVECGEDACSGGIDCAGDECDVSCGPGACHGAGDGLAIYGGAGIARYDCWGQGSCNGGIECSAQLCDIDCTGDFSCRAGRTVMNAGNAVLECSGSNSCNGQIFCNSGSCSISCDTDVDACGQYCPNAGCN